MSAKAQGREELKPISDVLIYFFFFFWFKEFAIFLHELETTLHFIAELIIRLAQEIC